MKEKYLTIASLVWDINEKTNKCASFQDFGYANRIEVKIYPDDIITSLEYYFGWYYAGIFANEEMVDKIITDLEEILTSNLITE